MHVMYITSTLMASSISHCLLFFFLLTSQLLFCFTYGEVPTLIVFGDSTVDAGNNNQISTILRSDFEPYGRDFPGGKPTGRFCNGRLATDFIAEGLGLGEIVPAYLDPEYSIQDFASRVCFASAGTGFDNATSDVLGVIPLWKEVEFFKEYKEKLKDYMGETKAEKTVNEAIYIISIGTNDFLENYFDLVSGRFKQFTVGEFEDFLIGLATDFITGIYEVGARKIVFAGLAPIGCLPLERTLNSLRGGECIEEYNEVAREFNLKLQGMLNERNSSLPGIKLKYNNVYDPFVNIIGDPKLYGFENVRDGCCGTGKFEMGYLCDRKSPFTCADADKYAFWDAFHPSQKLNYIMANLTLTNAIFPDLL